jgi:capsular polysaccharide transport system permease protein
MAAVSEFSRSLRINLRVIGALLMREIITRYGRDNLGFLWLFVEPLLFTLGVAGLWILLKIGHQSTLPIVAFAITGYSPVLLWRNCASRCCMAIPPNAGLLYHRNVRVLDLFIARILLEVSGATMSLVVLTSAFVFVGAMAPPADLVPVLLGWFLLAWFGAGLALVLGALTAYSESVERLWHTASYLIFPLSGALFMVEWLPKDFQKLVLLIPMVSGVEMLREGYFGAVVRTHYDASYLAGVCILLTFVGLILVRDAARRVEVE